MNKQQILWNILQPGDPYDIRKSMIAKLPNHPTTFMGDNIELVCLMQAAQIQRISEYLQQYKLRYKEISRRELDRHSYQVQIKQLTQKIIQYQTSVSDYEKLKDFVKRQSKQLQQANKIIKQTRQLSSLQPKYDSLLIQLNNQRVKIGTLQRSKLALVNEVLQWKQKYQNSQNNRITEINRQCQKIQLRFKQTMQAEIKSMTLTLKNKITQLENQIKLNYDQLNSKNYEIQSLLNKKQNLIKELQSLQSQMKSKTHIQSQYYRLTHQLEQANKLLAETNSKLQQIYINYQQIQYKYGQQQIYIQKLEKQKSETEKRIYQLQNNSVYNQQYQKLQNKIALLSSQLERITQLLKLKTNEHDSCYQKITNFQMQIRKYQNQKSNYQHSYRQQSQKIKSLESEVKLKYQSDNTIKNLSHEIQRLGLVIKTKIEQIVTLEQRLMLNQASNKDTIFLKQTLSQKQKLIYELKNQIDRINGNITIKNEQISTLQQRIYLNQTSNKQLISLKQIISDRQRAIAQLKNQIDRLNRFNEQPLRKIKILEQKVYSYEASMPKLSQQIQRLKTILHSKSQQLNSLSQQYQIIRQRNIQLDRQISITKRQYISTEKVQIQIKKRIQIFETKIYTLQNQKRNFKTIEQSLRNKINMLQNQYIQNQQSWRRQKQQMLIQISQLKKNVNDFQKEQMKRKIQNYQARLQLLQRENLQLKRNEDLLKKKFNNLQSSVIQNNQLHSRQKDQLLIKIRNLQQLQSRVSVLDQQNRSLKNKIDRDVDVLRNQLINRQNILNQIQQLKRQNSQLNEIAHQLQSKCHQLQYGQDQKNSNISRQLQILHLKLQEKNNQFQRQKQNNHKYIQVIREKQNIIRQYQNKLVLTTQQLERITIKIFNIQKNAQSSVHKQQFQRLHQSYRLKCQQSLEWEQKYTSLYRAYRQMQQAHNRMYSQHENTKRILHEYQNKISKLQSQFESLNRLLHELSAQNQKLKSGKGEVSDLQAKNRQLAAEIDRLNAIIDYSKRQIQQLRLRMTDNVSLERKIEDFMALMVILFAQIQTLRRRVKDTEQQCQNIRRSSLSPFKVK